MQLSLSIICIHVYETLHVMQLAYPDIVCSLCYHKLYNY
jgi:hypothetical protein